MYAKCSCSLSIIHMDSVSYTILYPQYSSIWASMLYILIHDIQGMVFNSKCRRVIYEVFEAGQIVSNGNDSIADYDGYYDVHDGNRIKQYVQYKNKYTIYGERGLKQWYQKVRKNQLRDLLYRMI